jgi:hypothetical protein
MQNNSRRIRTTAASSVLAVAVLATAAAASTKTPTGTRLAPAKPAAQLLWLQPDRYEGDTYIWTVDGVQRGIAFQ